MTLVTGKRLDPRSVVEMASVVVKNWEIALFLLLGRKGIDPEVRDTLTRSLIESG